MGLKDGACLEGKNVKLENYFRLRPSYDFCWGPWRVIRMADPKKDCEFKQDIQCTYNVTLRRVRLPVVAVEKQ